jgi:hypothetical protein
VSAFVGPAGIGRADGVSIGRRVDDPVGTSEDVPHRVFPVMLEMCSRRG